MNLPPRQWCLLRRLPSISYTICSQSMDWRSVKKARSSLVFSNFWPKAFNWPSAVSSSMQHQKKQMTVAKTFFKGQFSRYLAFWTKTLERACSTYRKICDTKNFRYDDMSILGDPVAVSRAGRKDATKVFKHRRKSPWVPTLTGPFPNGQANAGSWLGTKNALYYCAQSANSISWVLFGEFVHDGYWLDYGLSGSYTKEMHAAVRKLSVWYKLSGIIKILSTRRLKTLFQKYKPELTTGIHASIDHAP